MSVSTIDSFTRADGPVQNGGGSTVWKTTTITGGAGGTTGGLTVESNQLRTWDNNGNQSTIGEVGPDFNIGFQVAAWPSNSMSVRAAVQDDGTATWDAFELYLSTDGTWEIDKYVNATPTVLKSVTQAIAVGNWVRWQRVGTVLSGWLSTASTPDLENDADWTKVIEQTGQSDYAAAGPINIRIGGAGTRLDNLIKVVPTVTTYDRSATFVVGP